MSGSDWSREWLDMAEKDLGAAEFLLDMRPVPVEIICYHCQQAAEKLLKGALVRFDIEPPKTHDLVQLCKLCCGMDERFSQLADACVELSPYGVQVRYPSDLELNETDMTCALHECKNIQGFIHCLFAQDESPDVEAGITQPPAQNMQ